MALLIHLEGQGMSDIVGVRDYLQRRMDERLLAIRRVNYRNKGIRRKMSRLVCSECGGLIDLMPVNVSACTRTGDDSRTAIICRNMDCMRVDFDRRTVRKIMASNGVGGAV